MRPSNLGEVIDDLHMELFRFLKDPTKLLPPSYLSTVTYAKDNTNGSISGWVRIDRWRFIAVFSDDRTFIDGTLC